MKKFIRKYYQEIIAVLLIAGFWGGIWGHHEYKTLQANVSNASGAVQPHADLFNN